MNYKLKVTNNSSIPLCPFIYQDDVKCDSGGQLINAWLSNNKRLQPSKTCLFGWTIQWGTAISDYKTLNHGTYSYIDSLNVDIPSASTVDEQPGSEPTISLGGDVFPDIVAIHLPTGLTPGYTTNILMGGSIVATTKAQAGMHQKWTCHPSYNLIFGDYMQGEVCDLSDVSDPVKITFLPGVYSASATFDINGKWTIVYSSPIIMGRVVGRSKKDNFTKQIVALSKSVKIKKEEHENKRNL